MISNNKFGKFKSKDIFQIKLCKASFTLVLPSALNIKPKKYKLMFVNCLLIL